MEKDLAQEILPRGGKDTGVVLPQTAREVARKVTECRRKAWGVGEKEGLAEETEKERPGGWGKTSEGVSWNPSEEALQGQGWHEKEGNVATCSPTDGFGGHYAKLDKSDRERRILYDLTYMWNLKHSTH